MAAGDDQLVPLQADLIDQQPKVGFAEARRRIAEALPECRAEGAHRLRVDPLYRKCLSVLQLGHLGQDLAAPGLELFGPRPKCVIDRDRAVLDCLV